jgi:outer membrane lipoprotein-sorting protein
MTGRTSAFALAAIVCLTGAGRAAQQSVDDIVRRNIEAKGGLARLQAVTTMKEVSALTMNGMEATLTIYSKRPNLVRQEVEMGGTRIINAFDGLNAWIVNPMSGSTAPIVISGPQADMIRDESSFDPPLVDYKAQGYTVAISGQGYEPLKGKGVLHLLLTSRNKQVTHLYLDTITYLEVMRSAVVDQLKMEQEFDDYRVVDGIKFPHLIRTLTNGAVQSEKRVKSVEFNARIDDSMFRMPK